MIINDVQGFISVLEAHDVFYPFSKQPTGRVRVCVVLHYPMQKKWWPETKGVHEHQQLDVREEKLWPTQGHC